MSQEKVEFLVVTIKVGLNAVLMDIEGEEVWVPKSIMEEWPDVDDEGEIELPEWFAIQEGLV